MFRIFCQEWIFERIAPFSRDACVAFGRSIFHFEKSPRTPHFRAKICPPNATQASRLNGAAAP